MRRPQPNLSRLRGELMAACGQFAACAFGALDPALAARLVNYGQHVVVRCHPPRARLLVESPDGKDITIVHTAEGQAFPPSLGKAVAAVVTMALEELDPESRAHVVTLHSSGHSLGVAIECTTQTARVIVDGGVNEPVVIGTLQNARPEVYH